jgi:hypothetical protein
MLFYNAKDIPITPNKKIDVITICYLQNAYRTTNKHEAKFINLGK